jgi:hypothetical protein
MFYVLYPFVTYLLTGLRRIEAVHYPKPRYPLISVTAVFSEFKMVDLILSKPFSLQT